MASFIQGVSEGLQTGMAVDNWQRQRAREPIVQKQQDDLADLHKRLADMQMEDYTDQRKRRDALNKINDGLGAIESGQFDSPALVDAVNAAYGPQINQGNDGDIVSKRVSHLIPVPGSNGEKMTLGLEVTKKDGTTYNAPWTQNRSTDPNDPVQTFSTPEAIHDLVVKKDLLDQLEAKAARLGDPYATARLKSKEDRAAKVEDAATLHKNKLEEITATASAHKKYGLTKSGQSADMQMLDYFTSDLGYSPQEAMQYLSEIRDTAKINPVEAARNIYSSELKALTDAGITPDDPKYDQYKQKAWESAQQRTKDILETFPKAPGLGLTRKVEMTKSKAPETPAPTMMNRSDYAGPVGVAPASTPPAVQSAPVQQPQQNAGVPPPEAFAGLAEGHARRFKNGTVWTLQNGKPVQVP